MTISDNESVCVWSVLAYCSTNKQLQADKHLQEKAVCILKICKVGNETIALTTRQINILGQSNDYRHEILM